MIASRKFIPLFLAASVFAGCSGGGSAAPSAKDTSAKSVKALAFVHIQWPSKKTSSSTRRAKFITTSATRVEVRNTGFDSLGNSIPASDLIVNIPAGMATAQIPAFTNGNNAWSFNEFDSSNRVLASAYVNYGTITDPATPVQIDAVLTTNSGNMGVLVSSPNANGSCSVGTPCASTVTAYLGSAGSPASINTNVSSFTLYLQPTDLDGVLLSGAGVPGVSLTDPVLPDANVTTARLASDTTGSFAGAPKYSISLPNGFSSCSTIYKLRLNAVTTDASNNSDTHKVGDLNISGLGC